MKRSFAAAAAALLAAALCLTGCSNKIGSSVVSSSEAEISSDTPTAAESESMALMRKKYADVKDAQSGPVIKISDTEASPGEIAEVTVTVSNAEGNWNMCGIHITYPDLLECQLANEEKLLAKYHLGPAAEESSGFVAMDWRYNLDEELIAKKQRSLFFTTMFTDGSGLDGDIATFYFKVPDNAVPGAVYQLGYYYMESDMFRNPSNDASLEKYAFEHLVGGSITVK